MTWEAVLKGVKVRTKHLNLLVEYIEMVQEPVKPGDFFSFMNERNLSNVPAAGPIRVAAKKDDRFNFHGAGRDIKIGLVGVHPVLGEE
jgi:hypothetical protein